MNDEQVRRHYQAAEADPVAQVRHFLAQRPGPLSGAELAGLDQFHVRGLEATRDFIGLLDIAADMRVLDAGSGLGGPARYVAETHGCRVTGVDLTPGFVAVATLLAERTGMDQLVDYRTGDLLALDFPDAQFDVVYTQHVVMNIADRARLYGEIARVLKPGGTFGFYDVLAVEGQPAPDYPVPWSASAATSFLLTEAQTRAALGLAGLQPHIWKDVSAESIAWFGRPRPASPSPGLALVMGPRFGQMSANFARNLHEQRVRLVMGACIRR